MSCIFSNANTFEPLQTIDRLYQGDKVVDTTTEKVQTIEKRVGRGCYKTVYSTKSGHAIIVIHPHRNTKDIQETYARDAQKLR